MNIQLVCTIFDAMIYLWTLVSLGGYVLYKFEFDSANTWEAGVKLFITGGFNFLWDCLANSPRPETIVNTTLRLENKEIVALVKVFQNHPYETPTLKSFSYEDNGGIMRFDISAVGLSTKYSTMTNDTIREICYNIIQNYFMETRECMVAVFIGASTPQCLSVAIPLSEHGRKMLLKQQTTLIQQKKSIKTDILEEEIDLFEE